MFKFKFIREGEKYNRDLAVIAELGQIALLDPSLTPTDINKVTIETVKDLTNLMDDRIDSLTNDLIKSKMLNIVLSGNLAVLYYLILRK